MLLMQVLFYIVVADQFQKAYFISGNRVWFHFLLKFISFILLQGLFWLTVERAESAVEIELSLV